MALTLWSLLPPPAHSVQPFQNEGLLVIPLKENNPDTVSHLLRRHSYVLEHSNSPVSKQARLTLWLFGHSNNTTTTVPSVPMPTHRRAELAAINSIDSALNALESDNVAQRIEAVDYLGDDSSAPVIAPLSLALMDEDSAVRAAAITALAAIEGYDVLPILALAALQDENADIRTRAVYAMSDRGETAAIPFLQQALSDSHAQVRETARELLLELHISLESK